MDYMSDALRDHDRIEEQRDLTAGIAYEASLRDWDAMDPGEQDEWMPFETEEEK